MNAKVIPEVDDGIPNALQESVREQQGLEAQLSWSETVMKNMTTISPRGRANRASEGDVVSPLPTAFTAETVAETAVEVHLFALKKRTSTSLRKIMARQRGVENLLDIMRKTSIPSMTVLPTDQSYRTNSEDEAFTRILDRSLAAPHHGQASSDVSLVWTPLTVDQCLDMVIASEILLKPSSFLTALNEGTVRPGTWRETLKKLEQGGRTHLVTMILEVIERGRSRWYGEGEPIAKPNL